MSTMHDRDGRATETVSLTMAQLWRLAAGESVTLRLDEDRAGPVELEAPEPFDGTLPAEASTFPER